MFSFNQDNSLRSMLSGSNLPLSKFPSSPFPATLIHAVLVGLVMKALMYAFCPVPIGLGSTLISRYVGRFTA